MNQLHAGAFVSTSRSPEICTVLGIKVPTEDVRLCRLRDGKVFTIATKHVNPEAEPAERYREHVRKTVEEARKEGRVTRERLNNFSEYLAEYLLLAVEDKLQYRINAAINFVVIALMEMEQNSFGHSYTTFWLDVCWFCSQLGIDSPTRSLVKSRIVNFQKYIAPRLLIEEDNNEA